MELQTGLGDFLKHLLAHRQTLDPLVLVYDNRGTFGSRIGNIITINPENGKGALFGVPIVRTVMPCGNSIDCPQTFTWVNRSDLNLLISRVSRAAG